MKPPPDAVVDLYLDGLNRPVRLANCGAILDELARYFPGWPFQLRDPGGAEPVATLAFAAGTFRLTSAFIEGPRFHKTAVNALCDLTALLPQALAAQDADLMCLHAAAVEIGGAAILFPAVRRSGKSLLSAGLAARGAGILSDDVVALTVRTGAPLMARAGGIATRLRLPLPRVVPGAVLDFLAANAGPRNRQYRYLAQPGQPGFGASYPIGGVVVLERRGAGPASFCPEPRGDILRGLLHQHFTRDRDSAQVMEALYLIATTVPCWRLIYTRLQDGIDLVLDAAGDGRLAAPARPPVIRTRETGGARTALPVATGHRYSRSPNADLRDLDGQFFAVSQDGGRIVHLNDGAMRIWAALAEPATASEISALICEVFPDVPAGEVTRDTQQALNLLHRLGLVI